MKKNEKAKKASKRRNGQKSSKGSERTHSLTNARAKHPSNRVALRNVVGLEKLRKPPAIRIRPLHIPPESE